MGFVKRRGMTKAKVYAENFEALRKEFLSDIASTVAREEIPPELVLN